MRKFSRKILQTRKKLDAKHGFSLLQTSLCLPAKISLCLITGPRERCSWSQDDQSVAANVGKADMCTKCKSYLRSICNDCAKITSSSLDNLYRSTRCNCKFTKLINFTNEQSWTRTDQEISGNGRLSAPCKLSSYHLLPSQLCKSCSTPSKTTTPSYNQHENKLSPQRLLPYRGPQKCARGQKCLKFSAFKDPNIYKMRQMHQIIKALRPWAE